MSRTLVLSADHRPCGILPWQDAVTMLFNNKARVLATWPEIIGRVRWDQVNDFDHFLQDIPQEDVDDDSIVLRMPAVVLLKKEISRVKRKVKFSRENVLLRDNFRCQYCGFSGDFQSLNYDHVVPRSRGGRTDWTNISTSCYPCNTKKGGRTPEEAGMTLLRQPFKPRTLPMSPLRLSADGVPSVWRPWIQDVA